MRLWNPKIVQIWHSLSKKCFVAFKKGVSPGQGTEVNLE